MSTENKSNNSTLAKKLQRARSLLDECIAELGEYSAPKQKTAPASSTSLKSLPLADLDFEAHERAFVKAHARGLSGPRKFVLLVAYLAKGKVGTEVELKVIEKHWNKMTAPNLLDGTFNRFYTNAAKEQGWVNTKKQGVYFLRPQWRDIIA